MSARDGWLDDLHPEAYRTLVEGVPAILYIDRPDELSTNLYTSPQIEPRRWTHTGGPTRPRRRTWTNTAS